eukprot:m.56002 g.56002  ORF g.56002 m.56002 type:complete len:290 (+) comp34531_c0_seq9:40-909(+)
MAFLLLSSFLVCFAFAVAFYKPAKIPAEEHVISARPHEYLSLDQLPDNFDWKLMNGTVYVTRVGNQLQPHPCGSCWAIATTGALSDRIKIATKSLQPDINISPQVLLDCGSSEGIGSCYGGDHLKAYEFIHNYGITDETCTPYLSVAQTNWGESDCRNRMCRTCDLEGNCYFINGTFYTISEYGSVLGEDQMKAEIYKRGPIACLVYAHGKSFLDYKGGIITDDTPYNTTTHVVAITGWGVDSKTGMTFWAGRNSFGTSWGENGWFKLQRGTNCLDIEKSTCTWAVPEL